MVVLLGEGEGEAEAEEAAAAVQVAAVEEYVLYPEKKKPKALTVVRFFWNEARD